MGLAILLSPVQKPLHITLDHVEFGAGGSSSKRQANWSRGREGNGIGARSDPHRISGFSPQALAVLRIVTGALFVHGGVQILFNIPASTYPPLPPEMSTIMTIAGVFELAGGVLIVLGLLTRPAAFILCGMMAVAYWGFHVPMDPWPANNLGVAAILYCFIFFYLFFAGPGAWSIDAIHRG